MHQHEQRQRAVHTGRRNQRPWDDRHDGQSLLQQHTGSQEFALGDNIVDPSTFQPYYPQSFQQSTLQSAGDRSFTDPAILESNGSHGWSQQQGSVGQQQSWGHGNPAFSNDIDASYYQVNAPDAPGGHYIHQEYSHEPGGRSTSMMSSQAAHQRVPSLAFHGPMSSSMQTPEYDHQPDATTGIQMIPNASVDSHGNTHQSHEVDPRHFDLVDGVNVELLDIGPERPPWSTYQTAGMQNSPYSHEQLTIMDWQHTSETTFSTTDREGSGSGYIPESCTPLSSRDCVSGSMLDSTLTERPDMGFPQSMDPDHISPDCPSSWSIPQIGIDEYIPPIDTQPTLEDCYQYEGSLAVPMRRSRSTRSSVSDASSTGPPIFTPEVMYCDVGGCRQAFSGLYRRGNLGRHRRQKHREGKAYMCEDDTCAKEFQRKDARLKHYRRNHPELAVDSPLVRRSSASRSARRNQEVEFSNMSSWAG